MFASVQSDSFLDDGQHVLIIEKCPDTREIVQPTGPLRLSVYNEQIDLIPFPVICGFACPEFVITVYKS